jgi:osmotically-inducible protein OsmY
MAGFLFLGISVSSSRLQGAVLIRLNFELRQLLNMSKCLVGVRRRRRQAIDSRADAMEHDMKTDEQLKKDVTAELEWDPSINATQVGVAVKNGVVTLTGHLDTYAEKYAIERAVQRVRGVNGIAVEVDVKLDPSHKRSDFDIAAAAESAFKWHALIPSGRIQVMAEKGWVTLKGEVDWEYQRREAEKAVRTLTGVVGVSNGITLNQGVVQANVATRIQDALVRHAENEARGIEIIVLGTSVTLRGKVNTWSELKAASIAAWSAPGVSIVVNELKVQPG